jgi:PAS domain S-box-containing protein
MMMTEKNGNQILLDDSHFLVSRTDMNGTITYVNDDFCRISGYEREELIGLSHNIIRHPDMPHSVFAEMWKTIKKGEKWHGYVKNRAKNGSYYWVEAEISPHVKDGEQVGYKSVRKMMLSELIAQYEKEYARLKKDEEGSFNTWTIKNENYEEFDRLSKELNISKVDLFTKMMTLFRKSIKK